MLKAQAASGVAMQQSACRLKRNSGGEWRSLSRGRGESAPATRGRGRVPAGTPSHGPRDRDRHSPNQLAASFAASQREDSGLGSA
jgi:hypothetical protein